MKKIAITGANSYTGRYVAKKLLFKDYNIVNLTNHPNRSWKIQSNKIIDTQLKFQKSHLINSLKGCQTLIQTYWVRFDNSLGITRQKVTQNSKLLIDCARQAGVKKIIYTSHTQTSLDSPFDYIKQKAKIQKHLKQSNLSWGIVRPCGIFGVTPQQSILANNMTYLIRKSPIFPLPGDGNYIFQFVHVQDMADLIIRCIQSKQNLDVDAVGPDKISFKQIILSISKILNTKCIPITGMNKKLIYNLTKPIDFLFKDKFIDTNDLDIMMSGLTQSHQPPTGKISFLKWVQQNKYTLGTKYISSVERYYK